VSTASQTRILAQKKADFQKTRSEKSTLQVERGLLLLNFYLDDILKVEAFINEFQFEISDSMSL